MQRSTVPVYVRAFTALFLVHLSLPTATHAQAPSSQPADQNAPRVTLPPVTVTAQKEPASVQELPVSVTTVLQDVLQSAGIVSVSGAAIYAPNTFFNEFTARKLSNPIFRGIGSSPANPGIATYIDGVPQLNTNSSSIEFLDIRQVEFVRGPQSALFGRNALGGIVNITSAAPSLTKWTGGVSAPIGNYSSRDIRGSASGPLGDRVALGVAFGHSARDGFTTNDITGNDIDYRSATFGKAQVLWTPAQHFETRVIVSGERARDGDYALQDLGSLRQNPYRAARDFEGRTNRDIVSTTVLTRLEGQRVTLSTTTGFVRWETDDLTDLDYTPLPMITRSNVEQDFQFTQEVRVASAPGAAVTLADRTVLRWQAGAFFFTQNYDQDAVNTFAPFLLSPSLGFEISRHSPQATLDDVGIGLYGQGTATLGDRLDVTVGARFDHEQKDAVLDTFFDPQISPPTAVDTGASFSNVSPQLAISYRVQPQTMTYVSLARGFKAGGFNPQSPAGSEAYDEEHTWNLEGGLKTVWANGRVSTNVAAFYIDWSDLQLNVPNPLSPAEFYIANVAGARSRGVEVELTARPRTGIDVFGAFGYTHARFADDSVASGADVSGRKLANTPDYNATIGAQFARPLTPAVTLFGRGEAVFYGAFKYDEANTTGQDAYSIANFRAGLRGRYVFAEAWVRNAFDTEYIPVAFPYPNFAPSGFVGEMGRPRTFGLSAGVSF